MYVPGLRLPSIVSTANPKPSSFPDSLSVTALSCGALAVELIISRTARSNKLLNVSIRRVADTSAKNKRITVIR